MKLRSPLAAMLWELWTLTCNEAAWRFALPVGCGLVVMGLCAVFAPADDPQGYASIRDGGVLAALILLVAPNFLGWVTVAKLNGNQPGFPLHHLYTRPVRTVVIVGVPMLYLTTLAVAIYMASALLLRAISGYPFPLLPLAAWIMGLTVIFRAVNWSTRSIMVLTLGSTAAFIVWVRFARYRLNFDYHDSPDLWAAKFDFSFADVVLIALIGIACFAFTVARVAQQRRGDTQSAAPPIAGGRLRSRLIDLFHLQCPTTSAIRAQIWFDLKSRGLPLLTIGAALAAIIFLLFAASGPIDAMLHDQFHFTCEKVREQRCFIVRGWAWLLAVFSPLVILGLGGNAFGIRWNKGGISTFDATQPCDTAWMAGLRILTSVACILGAITITQVSTWISMSVFGVETFRQVTNVPLNRFQDAFMALGWGEWLALAVLLLVFVCVWVAVRAALGAIWIRHARRVSIGAVLILICSLALVLLAYAVNERVVSPGVVGTIFTTARWMFAAVLAFMTAYLLWSGFAERVITLRYLCVALVVSAAFGVAWLTVLHIPGETLAGKSMLNAAVTLSPALLPLILGLLAPWSLNRIRHV
jgi:hypothetical protein